MDILAETNAKAPGRYVLVPRKGERFLGPRSRNRIRVRRRRRLILSVLLEATGLTLVIGLFPPLRPMLIGTLVLAVLLLAYVGLLLKLKTDELHRARLLRARARQAGASFERVPVDALRGAFGARGNGAGHTLHRRVHGNGTGGAPPAARPVGVATSAAVRTGAYAPPAVGDLDEGVHVVIRPARKLEPVAAGAR